jgi:hypothetical protein
MSDFVKWLQYSFFRVFRYIFSTSLLLHETRREFFITKQDCEVRFMHWHEFAENSLSGFIVQTQTGQLCYNRDMVEVSSSA